MHARSALFDLYGDHLLLRDGWAPVSAVVGLLGSLGVSAPATRTAVSRLVHEKWLEPEVREQRGYAASDRARSRLAEAAGRIYRTSAIEWDGRWHLVVLPKVGDRSARARIARSLGYLGYGQLAPRTWIAPRRNPELDEVLSGLTDETSAAPGASDADGRATTMTVRAEGPDEDIARRVWDLDGLEAAYEDFLRDVTTNGEPADDETAFVERARLVHRWRLFLFSDPGLPAEVLPAGWSGHRAAEAFDARARALRPRADAYVDAWLRGDVG